MRVISISRRTDIPAFYTPWLLKRLQVGFCHVAGPYGGPVARVSLRAEECLALVFWTRDPRPLLPHLGWLRGRGYRFYAQVTVTGYPPELDPLAPGADSIIAAMHELAEATAQEFVVWRYDPILLSNLIPLEAHLVIFSRLAKRLAGATRRCIISFADFYAKTTRNLALVPGLSWSDPAIEEKGQLANALAEIATEHGIAVASCCEAEIVGEKVLPAHCVDADLLHRLRPDVDFTLKSAPSRKGCGCAASVDIGAYDTCAHGCRYCYATSSLAAGQARLKEHNPDDTILWRPPSLRGVELPGEEPPAQGTLGLI